MNCKTKVNSNAIFQDATSTSKKMTCFLQPQRQNAKKLALLFLALADPPRSSSRWEIETYMGATVNFFYELSPAVTYILLLLMT